MWEQCRKLANRAMSDHTRMQPARAQQAVAGGAHRGNERGQTSKGVSKGSLSDNGTDSSKAIGRKPANVPGGGR